MSLDKEIMAIARIAKELVSFEFGTKEEMDSYLKVHPKADKSNHWVKNESVPERAHGVPVSESARRDVTDGEQGKVFVWTQHGKPVSDKFMQDRIEGLRGTKAWSAGYLQCFVSPDPKAEQIAWVLDKKQRIHRIYSAKHYGAKKKQKYERAKSMTQDIASMRDKATRDRKSDNVNAWLFYLEDETAIRIGSKKDRQAEKKSYGLTTLEGRHVEVDGDTIRLRFDSKNGKVVEKELVNGELAKWIAGRKEERGDGPLFQDTNDKAFNSYLSELSPNGRHYTAKDFRTYHGTGIAFRYLSEHKGDATTPEAKKKLIRDSCVEAAKFLGNTPAIAKEDYIDPIIWGYLDDPPVKKAA